MLLELMLGMFITALSTWLTALATTLGVLTAVAVAFIPAYALVKLIAK